MAIKIFLADDHAIFRDGFRALIADQTDIELIGEAGNGKSAVDLCRQIAPDIVIMDITMPEMNGIDATRIIKDENLNIKVILLSIHSERHFITEALSAGASGYLLKNNTFEEIQQAIRTVYNNQTYLSPQVTTTIVTDYIGKVAGPIPAIVLTPRERRVLQLIAEGKQTKEIASELKTSTKTIEACRTQIMKKLDLHSVAELTKYAIRQGLTTIDH
jgi:DNA-binding NarL/FixJ family response regulator